MDVRVALWTVRCCTFSAVLRWPISCLLLVLFRAALLAMKTCFQMSSYKRILYWKYLIQCMYLSGWIITLVLYICHIYTRVYIYDNIIIINIIGGISCQTVYISLYVKNKQVLLYIKYILYFSCNLLLYYITNALLALEIFPAKCYYCFCTFVKVCIRA